MTTDDCPDCQAASQRITHTFRASCEGCCARMVARMPQYREAEEAGVLTRRYRRLLEQFGLEHAAVRQAAQKDRANAC